MICKAYGTALKKQRGMTLIEILIVLVVIGIIAAVATVHFSSLQGQSEQTTLEAASSNVRSAFAIAVTQLQRAPTVAELINYVQVKNATAEGDGIRMTMGGDKNYLIPTYSSNDCASGSKTTGTGETVRCIGQAVAVE